MQSDKAAQSQYGRQQTSLSRILAVAVVLAVLGIIAFVLWRQFGPRPGPQYGIAVNASRPIDDFTLDSTLGRPVALSEFGERYTMLYFGYTTCPDICPTTLADMGKAQTLLGDAADRVQMLFITVDPERDTPERMRDYLAYFGKNIIGLRGSLEETEAVAGQFGVVYQKQFASTSATDYLIDHSSVVLVLDPQRRPLVMFPFGVTAEQMAHDLSAVIR
ncbi:MAG: electron transporter SenC [Chloroflexota bacterium]|nr:SCO family protein [Caldilinea sp.]GIK75160.1 MAG: electron transporter SenC [Chloroflexota bacterium]